MKALTAPLGYLNVLLEYIDFSHDFQPHSKKDNFGVILFQGGSSPLSRASGGGGGSPSQPPPPPAAHSRVKAGAARTAVR